MNLQKTLTLMAAATALIAAATSTQAQTTDASSALQLICPLLNTAVKFMYYIAGGVAALVITLQGLKVMTSGHDKERKSSAYSSIIHAIIGLIIVQIAVFVVLMIAPSGCQLN
ncbi:Uncharacterised protein [uncultured archaeon]|nr:Uncharacterised protein [uncultured archaeon]